MANLAGEFAGMVQLEVPPANASGLAAALKDLESTGLKVAVSQSAAAGTLPAGLQSMKLDLIGDDQVGIVSKLTAMLTERNVSIEHLDTEVVGTRVGDAQGKPAFKVRATLLVPKSVAMQDLRAALDSLAGELMLDIALGD
jgi:glycine cleavage system regulatory protein